MPDLLPWIVFYAIIAVLAVVAYWIVVKTDA